MEVCGGLILPDNSDAPLLPEVLEGLYVKSSIYQPPLSKDNILYRTEEHTRRHATSKLTQVTMLLHRSFTQISRDQNDMITNVLKNVIIGLFFGVVFFKAGEVYLHQSLPIIFIT